MSDTPRTDDTCNHDLFEQETACADGFCPICATIKLIERSGLIDEAKDKIVQLERELAEAREELNDKRKFCYAVEQALDGMKGDYVEIIKELRKDAGA